MKRKIMNQLLKWKENKDRLPLIIYGARQIGKTYTILEFGKENFKNIVYVNFEEESALIPYFNDSIRPKNIIKILEEYYNIKINSSDTLIIFDEIQICNRALTSLKYFNEEAKEFYIISAGSLLGVSINANKFSFPVGKVQTITMYPMDFEEFLWAKNKNILLDEIKRCYLNNTKLENNMHDLAMNIYFEYILVGGMPLVVYQYISDNKILTYSKMQKSIVDAYIADMIKYSDKSQSVKTIATYESIVPQLAKENKKFKFNLIQKGARTSLFGESIDWLVKAGVVLKCIKILKGDNPPITSADLSSFKLYLSDIGLLSSKIGINKVNINKFDNMYMGAVTENYVANNLVSNNNILYYWESDNTAEIDFVIITNDGNIPIEVKSNINNKSKSLEIFTKKYNPKYSIRISAKNFGFENNIKSVPLYAVFCIN
ncbi:MAG: AAA family ATPase, partial [Clostridia bacterium]